MLEVEEAAHYKHLYWCGLYGLHEARASAPLGPTTFLHKVVIPTRSDPRADAAREFTAWDSLGQIRRSPPLQPRFRFIITFRGRVMDAVTDGRCIRQAKVP